MNTHDQETLSYFSSTKVKVCLVPRWGGVKASILSKFTVQTLFTHHQKTVCADAVKGGQDDVNVRELVSFVGGLDLAQGRFEWQAYPLFWSLQKEHEGDFQSKCVPGATAEYGPREPWHDIHAQVRGPAAYDVLKNFVERMEKQEPKIFADLLKPEDVGLPAKSAAQVEGQQMQVQVFRSADERSAVFDDDRKSSNYLYIKKGRWVDRSILKAYVYHIRRAKRFIYIENQYFIGGAGEWDEDTDSQADNLIPIEIALKICEKIKAGEPFCAYIVTPMFPEGNPASDAVQAILRWQQRTVQSMYRMIKEALVEVGKEDADVTDYMVFLCLATRENVDDVGTQATKDAPDNMKELKLSHKYRRHMVYVHSKMILIDDEYVLIGSANINQRSMAGVRDTEICIGCFQPDHIVDEVDHGPRGQVHGFRMSLWAELTGCGDDVIREPNSAECVAKIKELAKNTWDMYDAEEPSTFKCYMMLNPMQPDPVTNEVKPLTPDGFFHDTTANIMGSDTPLPAILTT